MNIWLLLWGLALGVTGALQSEFIVQLMRRVSVQRDGSATSFDAIRFRRRLNIVLALTLGVAVGLVSAISNVIWIDVALTAFAIVIWVPTSILAVSVVRRTDAQRV